MRAVGDFDDLHHDTRHVLRIGVPLDQRADGDTSGHSLGLYKLDLSCHKHKQLAKSNEDTNN